MKKNNHTGNRNQLRVQEAAPGFKKTDNGLQAFCPFCNPPHPLFPGQDSACGTSLKVTAVQTVIPTRLARMNKIVCVKCHKMGGGDMVKFNNGYIHLADCAPEVKLLAVPPKFSKWAEIVFGLPPMLRGLIEPKTGAAKQINEIDAEGKDTGKVLGYFFYRQ